MELCKKYSPLDTPEWMHNNINKKLAFLWQQEVGVLGVWKGFLGIRIQYTYTTGNYIIYFLSPYLSIIVKIKS